MSGSLRQLQHAFMDYLNTGSASVLQPHIVEQGLVNVDTRMAIYRNAYRVRLRETIETDHEVLGIYLGDDLFEQMVAGYIEQHPSKVVSLRDYCDDLPLYLSQQAPFVQYPIVADIAAFERRLLNAFDAPEAPRLSFTDLQNLPASAWPHCQLRFHPSLQLFVCQSNAVEAWQSIKAEQAPAEPDHSAHRYWLIWRGATRLTEFISLAPYQHALLIGFIQGRNFAEQCELMLAYFDAEVAPQQVLSALQAWFEMGLISRLDPA
ncbi:HvfC/BufC N-terminal domain-containing protein [Motilimonas eburnea]|uniref:HvfC/BufC N-terminal domain-containing protein n=1 Tax=Motilimonas eburnea TaxID=1737488 RepID=UPI001E38F0EC|nr:DNA-binding domain-containing protein [Motilimonas eburnea]MCE2572843.1 DNA-binding domain-containing protein [Motilimonas eburnea]